MWFKKKKKKRRVESCDICKNMALYQCQNITKFKYCPIKEKHKIKWFKCACDCFFARLCKKAIKSLSDLHLEVIRWNFNPLLKPLILLSELQMEVRKVIA